MATTELQSMWTGNRVRRLEETNEVGIQGRQRTYTCSIVTRSPNHCCRDKSISIIHSECVSVGLLIQHAMQMSLSTHIVMSGLSGSTIFFPHYLKKHDFRKTVLNIIKCEFEFLSYICPTHVLL
jgi:hypothetical protein